DDIFEMEFRELLDRFAVLSWVDIVLVRHRPKARFVVHGVACDAEGTRFIEERHAAARVTRREDHPQTVVDLSVVEGYVHHGAGMALDAGRSVVDALAGDRKSVVEGRWGGGGGG